MLNYNFNTSHVTVYHHTRSDRALIQSFQYIPCYGLSKPLTPHKLHQQNFNTSHVTVYQSDLIKFLFEFIISIHPMLRFIVRALEIPYPFQRFQYIPCYGLSISLLFYPTFFELFQYIPCYGLSSFLVLVPFAVNISIHPMLRFIFTFCRHCRENIVISIHPMLRFILPQVDEYRLVKAFQYIPCYGLSEIKFQSFPLTQ